MQPILIHVHIFYSDLWEELRTCVQNLMDYPSELFVSMVHKDLILEQKILDSFPKAHIEVVENKGYDVAPFISVLSKVDLRQYSYVVKLHTKRDMPLGAICQYYDVSGSKWRDYALYSFKDKENLKNCLQAFEKDKGLGMISDYHLIMRRELDDKRAAREAVGYLKQLNMSAKSYGFIAGSIFMCRAKLLQPLQKKQLNSYDFEVADDTHRASTFAHVVERLFGLLILAQGYEIKDVIAKKSCSSSVHFYLRKFRRFMFHKRVNSKGILRIKVCNITIPVFLVNNK